MTVLARIRRILDALGPFPARLRRPDVPCTVCTCDETDVVVEVVVDGVTYTSYTTPSGLTGLPPEPPVRSPESVRIRELLAEAPRTVAELEAALRAEGLSPWAAAPAVGRMSWSREAAVVAVEVVQDARGRHRAVRRWGLTTKEEV
jgi:hypothetical protein